MAGTNQHGLPSSIFIPDSGELGYGEPIHVGSASDFALAKEWYGEEVRSLNQGEAADTALTGSVADAFPQSTADRKVIYVALEFGTLPPMDVLRRITQIR
jgi:hypothetical protein